MRYRLCPPEVLAGQLDRLVSLSTLTTIRFGVIPFEAQLPVAPVHGFYVYDERMVQVEHLTAELKLTQPSEMPPTSGSSASSRRRPATGPGPERSSPGRWPISWPASDGGHHLSRPPHALPRA